MASQLRAPQSLDTGIPTDFGVFDRKIWEQLPEELMEKVVVKLDSRDLVNYRQLCRSWNSLAISSPGVCSLVGRTGIVYFPPNGLFGADALTVYNSKRKRWDKVNLGSLRERDNGLLYSLRAAHGGLLCFSDTEFTVFVIFNPLSKKWTNVCPPKTRVIADVKMMRHIFLVGLVVSGENYKLVLVALPYCDRSAAKTYLYDSWSKSWDQGPELQLPATNGLWQQFQRRSVVNDGKLYWYISDGRRHQMIRFDVETCEWANVAGEDFPNLVVINEHVQVVRAELKKTGTGSKVEEMWSTVLQCEAMEVEDLGVEMWMRYKTLIRREPLEVEEEAPDKYASRDLNCIGQETSLYFVHRIGSRDMKGWRILWFNYATRSHNWLVPFFTHVHEDSPSSWFTFSPSFAPTP